ncbi:MAG TPA: tetratricopeptide repeat protein, partial [Geothrix sp.]|nr:tetratricopeptide repeat protein [Geothrix sp.]
LELGEIDAAGATAAGLLQKFPQGGEGHRLKGMVAYHLKRYPEAIADLQTANKLQASVSGYYFLGLSHYHQGELESALNQFRLILDRVPTFIQARLLTGMVLLRQKRLDDAVAELTRVIEAEGQNALAHNLLGSAYMAMGQYTEGMQELDLATRLDPKLVDTHLKKGLFHLSQGKTAEVEADLATAVRVAPEALNTRFILCSFYLHRKNRAKALATLREGLSGKPEDAVLYAGMAKIVLADRNTAEGVAYLNKAKQINPDALDPRFTLAAHYSSSGNTSAALKEYQEILSKDPRSLKANLRLAALMEMSGQDQRAFEHYRQARESKAPAAFQALAGYFERRGESRRALAALEEGLKTVPRNAPLLEQKVMLHLKEKQYRAALAAIEDVEAVAPDRSIPLRISALVAMDRLPEALRQAERAISRKPESAYGFMLLASVHRAEGKLETAIAELKKGLERDKGNPQAALMLAGLYAASGRHDLAQGTCDEIVRDLPGFAPAFYAQGSFLEARGDKRGAAAKYRAALALSDSLTPALNNLAVLYAEGLGTPQEALQLAEQAFALEPANPAIMDTLGYALFKNGRQAEALRMLEKAEAILPGNPSVNYHLALVHRASGEKRQAVARLRKALATKDFAEATQARNLLVELN